MTNRTSALSEDLSNDGRYGIGRDAKTANANTTPWSEGETGHLRSASNRQIDIHGFQHSLDL